MRKSSLCLLLLSAVLAKAYIKPCKYWCKTGDHRYYCCPNGKNDAWSEQSWHSFFFPWLWFDVEEPSDEKPWQEYITNWKLKKQCPSLRPHCPRSHAWYKPPEYCDNDHECEDGEKCCYDVCLEHKICKDTE